LRNTSRKLAGFAAKCAKLSTMNSVLALSGRRPLVVENVFDRSCTLLRSALYHMRYDLDQIFTHLNAFLSHIFCFLCKFDIMCLFVITRTFNTRNLLKNAS
jgi:hypothetical protein